MESEGSRFYGKTMPSPIPNRSVRTVRAPIGVCGAVMPFNSPLAGIAWKVFPALLCGNAVVAKSHELTPYTAVAFGKLLQRSRAAARAVFGGAGLRSRSGHAARARRTRRRRRASPDRRPTGKLIQKSVSERRVLAKVCLELGGKNPLVVCDDADLQARGGARGQLGVHRRRTAVRLGQPHHRLSPGLRRVPAGDGEARRSREGRLWTDGRLRSGDLAPEPRSHPGGGPGRRQARRPRADGRHAVDTLGAGYYIAPTILDDVALDDELSQEELFGPVTCLYRVKDFDEAIAVANSTNFGLTGAIHTFNSNRIEEFIARYRAGLVSINGPTYGAGPHMPFGGVKNSGNGFREPGTEALDVYCEWKTVVVNHDPARV